MSEETKLQADIITMLERACRNMRALGDLLRKDSQSVSAYKKCIFANTLEASSILGKSPQEVEQTFRHVGLLRYNFDGEAFYRLTDILLYIKNTIHCVFETQKDISPIEIHSLKPYQEHGE